jgi:hypothetical protein
MRYILKYAALFMIMLLSFSLRAGDEFCGIKNTVLKDGETVLMKVFYSTMGMYIGAGEATFSINVEKYNGKPSFHCVGEGKTYPFFDNFFKVRDRYETYIDTNTMLPMKFIRNVQEGDTKIYNNVTFSHKTGTAVSTNGVYKVTPCIQDVISAVYYARNINFSKYNPGDQIPYDMFLDDEIYHLHISYIGKETVKTKYGKFNAIKFKPLLVKGTMFEGGEKMTVWVSDDPNHLILRIDSPISVGSVKVDMMGYKNLRYPLTSLISFR